MAKTRRLYILQPEAEMAPHPPVIAPTGTTCRTLSRFHRFVGRNWIVLMTTPSTQKRVSRCQWWSRPPPPPPLTFLGVNACKISTCLTNSVQCQYSTDHGRTVLLLVRHWHWITHIFPRPALITNEFHEFHFDNDMRSNYLYFCMYSPLPIVHTCNLVNVLLVEQRSFPN